MINSTAHHQVAMERFWFYVVCLCALSGHDISDLHSNHCYGDFLVLLSIHVLCMQRPLIKQ